MKLAMFSNILAALTFSGFALAQDGVNGFGPFFLLTQSYLTPINGAYLTLCHAGAALKVLCTPRSGGQIIRPSSNMGSSSIFYFNYTGVSGQPAGPGSLTWNMPASGLGGTGDSYFSVPLSLDPIANDNISMAVFQAGAPKPLSVAFSNDVLYVPNALRPGLGPGMRYWYLCRQKVGSYEYDLIAYGNGGSLQHPNCTSVDVVKQSV